MQNIGPLLMAVLAFGSLAYFIIQRLRGGGTSKLSALNGDEVGERVRKSLSNPQGVDELIALLDSFGDDWDSRDFYVNELADLGSLERLNQLNETAPTATTLLVRGVYFIEAAWKARGRGNADSVSKASWAKFEALLQKAHADLLASAEAYPEDPTPYGYLLVTARGLDAPLEEARGYFDAALALQPDHYRAHVNMLAQLSPRWGGGQEELAAFVAEATREAPVGSPLHMLVVLAHLDAYSDALIINKNKKAADRLLKNEAILDEMIAAYEMSLGSDELVERKTNIYLHNHAAFAFFMFQQPKLTDRELKAIGGAFTFYPWVYGKFGEEETEDVIERAKMITKASLKR